MCSMAMEAMSVVEDNGPARVIHIVVDHRHDGVGGRDDGYRSGLRYQCRNAGGAASR